MDPDYTDRERSTLGATPGICRVIDPTGTFICDLDTGHEGEHHGFEMPTITLDERF